MPAEHQQQPINTALIAAAGIQDPGGDVNPQIEQLFQHAEIVVHSGSSIAPTNFDPDAVTMVVDQKEIDAPVRTGTMDERGFEIGKLRGTTGHITYDPGLGNTGSCMSDITFINGEEGVLLYRGYPIQQLTENSNFPEVSYLLLHGELPTGEQLAGFQQALSENAGLSEKVKTSIANFPQDAHPMEAIASAVAALSAELPQYRDSAALSEEQRVEAATLMIAKMPAIVAGVYKRSQGEEVVEPRADLSYSENFLHMMFSKPGEDFTPSEDVVRAMDMLLILHADHEQNCSTSTVRFVGSSGASIFASVSAGVDALSGPKHGGANQDVLEMLEKIEGEQIALPDFIEGVKSKDYLLMGFGHRVYKNFDPRATCIKGAADKVLQAVGVEDPLLDLARDLEQAALGDSYFVDRKLFPNVDFYSGIVYRAMDFPTEMFTGLFALGRTPGWAAQWTEMRNDSETKIMRPRQIYTGEGPREYIPVDER